ncbi:CapA family protein [Pseudalkalibacillus caeni]|uniref:CapA family protein n=1 Tax=Exobacillus caeni TaxID=2574798 RepID=A0A5R9FDU2_9BACL|nr:CapA family protein [Pseudalkalibacillus caeni]TLS39043.1 CapA family protein [Pseudalkalibacillus caeni]
MRKVIFSAGLLSFLLVLSFFLFSYLDHSLTVSENTSYQTTDSVKPKTVPEERDDQPDTDLHVQIKESEKQVLDSATEPIELAFAGDVILEASGKTAVQKYGIDYPFEQIKGDIIGADYAVVNLETPITGRTLPFPKEFNFKSGQELLTGLTNAGFDMVTLANNHTMDYGEQGLIDTLKNLNDKKIPYIGAGLNEEEAFSSKTVEIKGRKIGFIGFSRVLPDVSWYAGKEKPGIASGYQLDRMVEIVKEAKEEADCLFVYIHWGKERHSIPEQYQLEYAKALVDAGADGIIGSHPHVLQGFQFYKNKPIAYSLGNFLFPDHVNGKTAESGILKLTINGEDIAMRFIPCMIKNDQIVKLDNKQGESLLNDLVNISYNIERENLTFKSTE